MMEWGEASSTGDAALPMKEKERIKHRRTRSGCYTCRSRRVKCDEQRPICERCRKGDRQCVYPPPKSSSKKGSSGKESRNEYGTTIQESSSEEDDESNKETLEGEENQSPNSAKPPHTDWNTRSTKNGYTRSDGILSSPHVSMTPGHFMSGFGAEKSPTPSTEGSVSYAGSRSESSTSRHVRGVTTNSSTPPEDPGGQVNGSAVDWSHLPSNLQFYLNYHHTHLTQFHYSFRHNATSFLRTTLIELALRHEHLLYAVVAFAAFQHTLRSSDGKIQDSLPYYNKAVSLLRISLVKGHQHTSATLLTILQLAAIEERLGDWVNLLKHQKAAFRLLKQLYTPQTITQSRLSITILVWYMRFDVSASLLGGKETISGVEWFQQLRDHHILQSRLHPEDISHRIEEICTDQRLIAMDMAQLFGRRSKGGISNDDFLQQNETLSRRFHEWREHMDPRLVNTAYTVSSFEGSPTRDPDDIVDPFLPGILYYGPLFMVNFALIDWAATVLMHKYQTALAMQTAPGMDIASDALSICQRVEALEYWPGAPAGCLVALQAPLCMAMLFLPKDERHINWCRRKLAKIEDQGFNLPSTFREKMATVWNLPEVRHWWLPNEEGFGSMLRSIRYVTEDRANESLDEISSDLYDMKALFGSLSLGGDSPFHRSESDSVTDSSGSQGVTPVQFTSGSGSPEQWHQVVAPQYTRNW